MDIFKSIGKAWAYAFSIGRMLPFLYVYTGFIVGLGLLAIIGFGTYEGVLMRGEPLNTLAGTALWVIPLLVLLLIALGVGGLWATAKVALGSQGRKRESATKPLPRMIAVWLVTLVVSIVVAGISSLFPMRSLVNFLLTLLTASALLFALYYVILRKKEAVKAIGASLDLFSKKPFEVLLAYVAGGLVAILAIVTSAIPLVIAAIGISGAAGGYLMWVALVIGALLVFLVGISFVGTFSAAFFANVLAELDKRRY
ncbi:Uncharacterised protein [Candidatus Norongarragalina meridionalis]|nr:Uncharacterised protein [Candidatus Norongarragalina meridionalis]